MPNRILTQQEFNDDLDDFIRRNVKPEDRQQFKEMAQDWIYSLSPMEDE
jgi:hypothetical protein